MECNKDEAERAKSIAESKLEQKDYAGSRKFATKAKALYPDLDGISQMLTTLEVYVAAENKISGEIDWYGVLSVSPTSDEETIKKQYRKLALALHPDKNKSIGADGAFKLISEAWSLLSDKAKRLAYNQRRGSRIFQPRSVPTHSSGPSAPPPPSRANASFNFASRTKASAPKSQNKTAKAGPSRPTPTPSHPRAQVPPTPTPRTDTFWTICHLCKMQYEYLKMYCNHTLLCPNCNKPFKALMTAPPLNFSKSRPVNLQQQHNSSANVPNRNGSNPAKNVAAASGSQKPAAASAKNVAAASGSQKPAAASGSQKPAAASAKNVAAALDSQMPGTGETGPTSFKHTKNYQQGAPSGTSNVGSSESSVAAKAANLVQQAANKLKRAFSESQPSSGWDPSLKKRKPDDHSNPFGMNYNSNAYGMNYNSRPHGMNYNGSPYGMNYNGSPYGVNYNNMAQGNGGFGTSSTSGSRTYGFSGFYRQTNRNRDLTPIETQNMLMAKAREVIRKKLNETRLKVPAAKVAKKEKKDKTNDSNKDKERSNSNVRGVHDNGKTNLSATKIAPKAEKHQASDDGNTENPTAVAMSVPDPDFHDFDQDRSENSFADNEVWAAYDDDDGMPRFYALISKVISRDPFKLRISWLNSKTNTEFSTLDWVGSGFYKTCGEFRVGRYETCRSINAFSERVNWSKGPRGSFLIFPQKDDVWALYKNWSSNWDENTPDEVIHKYEMVLVLDNYSEERGVSVAPLIKVVGFRTIFHPNLELEMIRTIRKEEMFRFSHRVPHHWLTSQEAQNAPKGCLELDPAATPMELLQMIKETNDVPVFPRRESVDAIGNGKQIRQGDETGCTQTVISGQV